MRHLHKADTLRPLPKLEEGHPSVYINHHYLLFHRTCEFSSVEGRTAYPLMDAVLYHNGVVYVLFGVSWLPARS